MPLLFQNLIERRDLTQHPDRLAHPLISNDLKQAAERRALRYRLGEAGHQWD